MGAVLLDPKSIATLQNLLKASSARALRETSAEFSAAFPDGGAASFRALSCLLVLLKVTVASRLGCDDHA